MLSGLEFPILDPMEVFHMWWAVIAPEAEFSAALSEQHVQACSVADGVVTETAEVDCQPG